MRSTWLGQGNQKSLHASIDTGGTWLPPVLACRRILTSPSPDCIEIRDEIDLAEPRAVTFYLHSPLAMTAGLNLAEVRGKLRTLTVRADWAVKTTVEVCGVNWCYTPINRLALVSAPSKHHRLVTVLEFKRKQTRTAK